MKRSGSSPHRSRPPRILTDRDYDVRELASCDAGISECEALIAQTGSVLVSSRSSGGRALSVLPPHHIVLARREQLLPDLPAAFALLRSKYASDYPSFILFITGPSRTGDIERILDRIASGASTEVALREVLHSDYSDVMQSTAEYLRKTYSR